jgi:Ca2+-binding EF-hand superfamily protein
MISRRTIVLAFTAGTFLAGVLPVLAKSRHSNWIRMFDTDNDGTVDLAEAKKAASELFDKLDRDHDGTFDKRELARRLTPKSSPLPILTTMERSPRTSISRSSSSVSLPQIQIMMGRWMPRN